MNFMWFQKLWACACNSAYLTKEGSAITDKFALQTWVVLVSFANIRCPLPNMGTWYVLLTGICWISCIKSYFVVINYCKILTWYKFIMFSNLILQVTYSSKRCSNYFVSCSLIEKLYPLQSVSYGPNLLSNGQLLTWTPTTQR